MNDKKLTVEEKEARAQARKKKNKLALVKAKAARAERRRTKAVKAATKAKAMPVFQAIVNDHQATTLERPWTDRRLALAQKREKTRTYSVVHGGWLYKKMTDAGAVACTRLEALS